MIELKNGDCLEKMKEIPANSVDLVLTDPPYNISRESNFHTMGQSGIDFGEWDWNFDVTGWIKELPRIMKKNGSVVIFNSWENMGDIAKALRTNGFSVKDLIRWEKSNPIPRNRDRRYVTDCEFAIWATNEKAKWIFNRQDSNFQRPKYIHALVSKDRVHPTQKPIKLMEELLKIHSVENQVILDPFMGGGVYGGCLCES